LWKGFTFLFKISIVGTLVAYFAVFLVMMLALVFARRSDDRDEDGGFDLGWPLFWMWGWGPSSQAPPLGRWFAEKLRDRGRSQRNAKRAILRIAIENRGAPLPPEQLAHDPVAAKVLEHLLVVLGGDVVTDDAGQILYAFPRIKEELDAVARASEQASGVERDAGAVIFSSKDPL